MTNKSILDGWEEQVRNMVYEVWTSHSSSKHMVELVGKLLQAQQVQTRKETLGEVIKLILNLDKESESSLLMRSDIINKLQYLID